MDIQTEVQKIHSQFGTTEMANYEIQKLFDKAIKEAVTEALRILGVYSPEDDLLAVHKTEDGAEDNKANYEKQHGEGFYVDYVMLQP